MAGRARAAEPHIDTAPRPLGALPLQKKAVDAVDKAVNETYEVTRMPPTVVPIPTDPTGADLTCKVIYKGKVIKEASGENVVAGCITVSPMGT